MKENIAYPDPTQQKNMAWVKVLHLVMFRFIVSPFKLSVTMPLCADDKPPWAGGKTPMIHQCPAASSTPP